MHLEARSERQWRGGGLPDQAAGVGNTRVCRRRLARGVSVILILLLGACRSHSGPAQAVLRYPIVQEPTTLDPAKVQDVYTSELLQNVFEGLVTIDENGRVAPALADRWEISRDGLRYTFHLRQNARFQKPYDRPVTADDVTYSLTRALLPHTASPTASNYLEEIRGASDLAAGKRSDLPGVKALDSHTVQITLNRPRGYFLGQLSYTTGAVVCREAVESRGGQVDERDAVGTGPFVLKEYRHGAKLVLERNPAYWSGAPPLERIERPIVVDPQTAHIMYRNGQVDSCLPSLTDIVADRKDPRLAPGAHLLEAASIVYVVLHPGLQPAFKDTRVRRAIAEAIDKDAVAQIAYQGTCQRADQFVPGGMDGWSASAPRMPYNPGEARKLLAEAGFPEGRRFPPLTLVYVEKVPELSAAGQLIASFLKTNLGIQVSLQQHEAATFWADTADEKIPFYLTGWIADYLDPQDFLSTLLRSNAKLNHCGYSNARFDALCDRADAMQSGPARWKLYQEADRIAMADVAVLPLCIFRQPLLVQPYVTGWRSNLLTFMLPHTTTRVRSR